MTTALVTLRGVTRWFGREQVLRGVDLDVPAGSVTAILGRNGSGKSTLLRIVAGLLDRHGGEAEVLGRDPERLGIAERERLGYVTDASGASAGTRVADEIALVRRIRGARWDEARAQELLRRFDVPVEKRLGALSKGQATRLRVILAVAANPELLLLDEPALGLDLFARRDLIDTVIETVGREGRGVLLASHLLDDVERVADRVAFLRQGAIAAQGGIEELRDRFRRARVALGPGGAPALEAAAAALVGVRGVARDPAGPEGERMVVFDGYADGLLAEVAARSGARPVGDVKRMALREVYFEVLAGSEGEKEVAA